MAKNIIERNTDAQGNINYAGIQNELTSITSQAVAAGTQAGVLNGVANAFEGFTTDSKFFFLKLAGEIEKFQVEALTKFGITDFNKEIGITVSTFQELNDTNNKFAISNENVKETLAGVVEAFDNTGVAGGKAIGAVTKAIAANTNIVDRSKLVPFLKNVTFQTGRAATATAALSNRLIRLATALRRPPSEFVNLVDKMAQSNATFAISDKAMEAIAIRSIRVGRQLGVATDAFQGFVDRTFTIQSRIQELSKLNRLAGLLGIAPVGRAILSTDAEARTKVAVRFLADAQAALRGRSVAQRQAFAALIAQETALGQSITPAGVRALIQGRGLDASQIEDLVRRNAGRKLTGTPSIDDLRRGAATTAQRLRAEATAVQLKASIDILKTATGNQTAQTKAVELIARDMQKVLPELVKAVEKTGTMAGQVAGGIPELLSLIGSLIGLFAGVNLTAARQQQLANLTARFNKIQTQFRAASRTVNRQAGSPPTPTTTTTSDIRLKENIKIIGASDSGIPVYNFSYINDPEGTIYQGAMAQDLLVLCPESVVIGENGYYAVDYSLIDIDFKAVSKLKNV